MTGDVAAVGRGWHPSWCGRGHRCGLGEHRAVPVRLTHPNTGTAVLTRVQAADGRQYAEIVIRVALPAGEPAARTHLGRTLAVLENLLHRVATTRPATASRRYAA
jgi:hypothetical protein